MLYCRCDAMLLTGLATTGGKGKSIPRACVTFPNPQLWWHQLVPLTTSQVASVASKDAGPGLAARPVAMKMHHASIQLAKSPMHLLLPPKRFPSCVVSASSRTGGNNLSSLINLPRLIFLTRYLAARYQVPDQYRRWKRQP